MGARSFLCPHCQESDPKALIVLELKDIPRFKNHARIVICRTCAFVLAMSFRWMLQADPDTPKVLLEVQRDPK